MLESISDLIDLGVFHVRFADMFQCIKSKYGLRTERNTQQFQYKLEAALRFVVVCSRPKSRGINTRYWVIMQRVVHLPVHQ